MSLDFNKLVDAKRTAANNLCRALIHLNEEELRKEGNYCELELGKVLRRLMIRGLTVASMWDTTVFYSIDLLK